MQPCKYLPSAKPLSARPLSRWGTDRCRTTSSHAIKDLGSGLLDYIEGAINYSSLAMMLKLTFWATNYTAQRKVSANHKLHDHLE